MARACPFNNGVLMLRNISAPFLNALKGNPRWTLRCCGPHNWVAFTGGRSGFFFIFVRYLFTKKKNAFLNLLAKKKRPEIEHNSIYIYIYAVELLSGPSLALLKVIIWSKFVFFYKTPIVKKHYKNRGFSTFFENKIAR